MERKIKEANRKEAEEEKIAVRINIKRNKRK